MCAYILPIFNLMLGMAFPFLRTGEMQCNRLEEGGKEGLDPPHILPLIYIANYPIKRSDEFVKGIRRVWRC